MSEASDVHVVECVLRWNRKPVRTIRQRRARICAPGENFWYGGWWYRLVLLLDAGSRVFMAVRPLKYDPAPRQGPRGFSKQLLSDHPVISNLSDRGRL